MSLLVAVTVASAASGPLGLESRPGLDPATPNAGSGLSDSWISESSESSESMDDEGLPADPDVSDGPEATEIPEIAPPGDASEPVSTADLLFPVAGSHTLTDSFGDPRGGGSRSHEGVDILADKGTPVVAVADGVVRWVHDEAGGRCCDVSVLHDNGWRTRYIHLNNDTPGTDDGRVVGIAEGIEPGVRVRQGQVLGWVGDSGNAEATVSHLHFELRLADGTPLDPFRRLQIASFPEETEDRIARR